MIKKMEKNQLKKLAENNLWERLDILCSIKAKLKDCSHIIEEEDNLNVSIQEQINNIVDILETLINTKNQIKWTKLNSQQVVLKLTKQDRH